MNDISFTEVVDAQTRQSQRRSARAAERRRRRRRRRTWVSVLVGVLVIGAGVSLAWFTIRPVIASFTAPKDWPGPGSGEVNVTIPEGASATAIGQVLRDAGVVKTASAFVDAAGKDSRAALIRPGVYRLQRQMSSAGALGVLVNPANLMLERLTIAEGRRLGEIVDAIAKGTTIPRADVEAALKRPAQFGLPPQAGGNVEGWLYPATYEVTPQTTAEGLLREMVSRTVQELNNENVPPAEWERTLTIASLVQAESGRVEDSPKIARVIYNRLAKSRPLQLDATVNYALKRYKVAVSEKDTKVQSPYNTYLPGSKLPPGPICSPGEAAIQATRNPAPGAWFFFVAVNPTTGETKFAVTEAEFFKLKAELDRWIKANPGK